MDIKVLVYEEEFIINQETNFGFDKVLKKMEPYINSLSYSWSSSMPNTTQEDLKQDIYIIAIEGIKNFDSKKKTKLSTFLFTHIQNKLISKKTSCFKKSKNASYIKDQGFSSEVFFDENIDENITKNSIFKSHYELKDDFCFFLEDLKNHVEYDTWLLLKYIVEDGYSLKEASDKLNMKFWIAVKRIKGLSKNKYINEFYEK